MQHKLRTRTKLVQTLRRYLDAAGFQDIETPILTKGDAEGARDYWCRRACIRASSSPPQSPQLFKQILMMAGMDPARSPAASATRICALIASRNSPSWTWSLPSSRKPISRASSGMIRDVFKRVVDGALPGIPRIMS